MGGSLASAGPAGTGTGFQGPWTTPSAPVVPSKTTAAPSATITFAPPRPWPVFMSWAKMRTWSADALTIASRSDPITRAAACKALSSVTLTT